MDGGDVVVDGAPDDQGPNTPDRGPRHDRRPDEDIAGNTKVGLELTAVIDRTEFGLNWNAPLPKGGVALGNDVTLSVDLELREQA